MTELPRLFSDHHCPFTRRVTLLLAHLGAPYRSYELERGQVHEGLQRYSPSLRLPCLVHEGMVLTESRVMLEYLAGRFAFDGWPADFSSRIRHAHAMAVLDDFVAPLLFEDLQPGQRTRLEESLDAVEHAAEAVDPAPCFLAFHALPLWEFARVFRPESEVAEAMWARRELVHWFDGALGADARALADPCS